MKISMIATLTFDQLATLLNLPKGSTVHSVACSIDRELVRIRVEGIGYQIYGASDPIPHVPCQIDSRVVHELNWRHLPQSSNPHGQEDISQQEGSPTQVAG